jgi:hypothetical protein
METVAESADASLAQRTMQILDRQLHGAMVTGALVATWQHNCVAWLLLTDDAFVRLICRRRRLNGCPAHRAHVILSSESPGAAQAGDPMPARGEKEFRRPLAA